MVQIKSRFIDLQGLTLFLEPTSPNSVLWNSMTLTSFVFTELANTMKYGEGFYITLFSPSDVTEFHRMKYGGRGLI